MSLRKPAFEGQEETKSNTTAVAEDTKPATVGTVSDNAQVAANQDAAETTGTAVAAPKQTALAVGSKYKPALEGFKNLIDPSSLDFDTFRRVTVGLDGFSDEAEVEMGKRIKIQLMSYNDRFICSPGKQDAESNDLVRYSLDGKTIDGTGELCADYIKKLVEVDGYEDASLKKYLNLYGFLVAVEEKGELKEIDPADREIVSIQVPPRSYSKFTRFQIEDGVKVSQGILQETDTVVLSQAKVKGKTTTYAEITFGRK